MKVFLLLVCFAITNAVIASTHKCENNGKVVFQDVPCEGDIVQKTSSKDEPEQRELFDKVFISELKITHGKQNKEYTPVLFEVMATNNTNNKIQIILRYDALDNEGLVIDTQTLMGSIDNNSNKKIVFNALPRRNALLNKIVKWRLNSWKSTIN